MIYGTAEHRKARRDLCRALILRTENRRIRLISTAFCSRIRLFLTCPIRRVGTGIAMSQIVRSILMTQRDMQWTWLITAEVEDVSILIVY